MRVVLCRRHSCKLDGQMPQATDADDANPASRLDAIPVERLKHGGATAEERSRVQEVELLWHADEERLLDHGVTGEGADVEVGHAVEGGVGAVHLEERLATGEM